MRSHRSYAATIAVVMVVMAVLVARPTSVAAQIAPPPGPELARVAAALEPEIRRAMLDGSIPSLTVALTDRNGELWSAAYGESNLWARTPASTNTV